MSGAVGRLQRIELNRTGYLDGLLQEEYQQPNPLPSHSKYAMRMRRPERELHQVIPCPSPVLPQLNKRSLPESSERRAAALHQPLKFSHNSNEAERILHAVEQVGPHFLLVAVLPHLSKPSPPETSERWDPCTRWSTRSRRAPVATMQRAARCSATALQ